MKKQTYAGACPLVDAVSLMAALERHPIVLLDASFDLADSAAGERRWTEGHIPGSQYAHLERDLSGPKTALGPHFSGRHPLPRRSAFAATAGRWGVSAASHVVVMDRQGGPYAARLWWMLRWLGHSRVWLLDGGIDAWLAAGGSLSAEAPRVKARPSYPHRSGSMPTISADELRRELDRVCLVDARAPERFRGEVEPLDSVAGHIPGALNRPFKDNLSASGQFKPREQLANEFAELCVRQAPGQVVHQCGSGVTACHNLLAMEAAGLPGARLYAGSWSEWSADPSRPVARGG
jgi:thiosulfate/3-mercaptopyruvate sulfurtransferase